MAGNITPPAVVKFAFTEFELITVNEKAKWRATCVHCKEKIVESQNTTTGFTSHVGFYRHTWP